MTKALINNEIISWALSRAAADPEDVSRRLGVTSEAFRSWLVGSDRPTFQQAKKLASILSIPFGYMYLNAVPTEGLPSADFRTVGGERSQMDVNTKSLLTDITYKRDWYKEYREQNGFEPAEFVGRFDLSSSHKVVARDIDHVLHGGSVGPRIGYFEDYLRHLMARAEANGIWVMRTGIVGSNTHKQLSVSDFRGLAIADRIVPLILINGQDSRAAQIFTFAHELAHLWVGESGVSSVNIGDPDFGARNAVEKFCNHVAAEFLVPEQAFKAQWRNSVALDAQVDGISQSFKVSRIVVARRARDCGFIDDRTYREFYLSEQKKWKKLKGSGQSGGDYYRTIPVRNGRSFTRSVVQEAMQGTMLLRDAAALLGVKPGNLREIYNRIEA